MEAVTTRLAKLLGVALAAGCALSALTGPAHASAPPPPPGCGSPATATSSSSTDVAIPDGGAVAATLDVSGVGGVLRDVDAGTTIQHGFPHDIDMTLTSPAGTVVTLTTDNGDDWDNVFRGTVWDDDAGDVNPPGAVTDTIFEDDVAEPTLVPEEAMGAFVGENPKGTWMFTIADDFTPDAGVLEHRSLSLATCSPLPSGTAHAPANNAATPLADNGTTTSTINVTNSGCHVLDMDAKTTIQHAASNDIEMTLTSPAGTVSTLTTDNGSDLSNLFRGTLWDDDAGDTNPSGAVTDTTFVNNVPESTLVPEEAMGAFIGENPNGTWTLSVRDDRASDSGTLESWSLAFRSAGSDCPQQPGGGGAPPPDTTRPVFISLGLSPKTFRAASRGGSIAAPVGTRVSYRLSEAGSARFRVDRAAAGRRSGRRCVRRTRRNRRARRCTRYIAGKRRFTRTSTAGVNSFRFTGRIGGRKLRVGSYWLVSTAADAAGNRSLARSARFRISRR